MKIGVDKNQLIGSHGASNRRKHSQMEKLGVELIPLRIPFGDYILIDEDVQKVIDLQGGPENVHKKDLLKVVKLSIDTKKDLLEVCQNICSKQHERFKRELLKGDNKLIILIEENNIECLEDVWWWENPNLKNNPRAVKGTSLYKSLCTIKNEYHVDIMFCSRAETGKKIIEILGKGVKDV